MPLDAQTLELLKQILAGNGAAEDPRLQGVTRRPAPQGFPIDPVKPDGFSRGMPMTPPPLPMARPQAAPAMTPDGFSMGMYGAPVPANDSLPMPGGLSMPPPPFRPQYTTPEDVDPGSEMDRDFRKKFLASQQGPPAPPVASMEGVPPMLERPPEEEPGGFPIDPLPPGSSSMDKLAAAPPAAPKEMGFKELLFGGDPNQRRLEGLTSIAEGLGNIDVMTGAQIRAGVAGKKEPFVAEGLRRRSAQYQDQISPDMAKSLEDYFGFKIPPGMRMSQLQKILPGVASVAGRRESAGLAQGNRIALQEDRQAEARTAAELRAKEREEVRGRITPAQTEELNDLERTIDHMEHIIGEKQKHGFNLGPIASRWHTLASFVGMDNAEKAVFKRNINQTMNDYINALSGKAVTVQEAERLKSAMPRFEDDDAQFEAKAKDVVRMLEEDRALYLNTLQSAGKDVENFRGGGMREAGASTAPEANGKRAVIGPNGESGKLPGDTDLSKWRGWRWK